MLIIAEAANPDWVSVPLIGWSLSLAMRDVADVHLVTQVRNRDAILKAGLKEDVDFTAIDSEAVSRPMWRLANLLRMGQGRGWTMTSAINAISYPYFEHLVWKRFGADIRGGRFDVVHRVTPLTPTTTSPLAHKCASAGVPFVMGPLNGGVPWPKGFDSERRKEREWLSYIRSAYKILPGRRKMLRAAAKIIVGSKHTGTEIPHRYADKVHYIPENGIDLSRFSQVASQDLQGPLRAVFIGRLVPYKGLDMGISAAQELLASGKMKLDVIGDGPMRGALENQVEKLGLQDSVQFHGQLAHTDVQSVAVGANILLFPSIREFGGGVVLEAMSLGVVPVIVDYAGPGELVTPETGLSVPIGSRDQITSDLRVVLENLVAKPEVLPELAKRGREVIKSDFTWAAKSKKIAEIYDSLT